MLGDVVNVVEAAEEMGMAFLKGAPWQMKLKRWPL